MERPGMESNNQFCSDASPRAIIAGYGLPGRAVAEALKSLNQAFCIIELNPTTVHRCELGHVPIIEGDCTDPAVLRNAGIQSATTFIIMIPNEKAAIEATTRARQLNPSIRIITRCHYTSAGLIAKAHGADEVIVAEQVVAAEATKMVHSILGRPISA